MLLHVFHGFGSGGAQTRFIRLANHFGKSLRHVIVAMNGDYSCLDRISADADVQPFSIELNGGLPSRLKAFGATLAALKPDCIVTHNWGTIEWAVAARVQGIRHIHIEDGFGPDEAHRQKRRRILFRRLVLRNSEVVVPSLRLKAIGESQWRIPPARLHHIPNGIDCTNFPKREPLDGWRSGEPAIGTVAALRPEKNIARLLQAFAHVRLHRACRLTIVGEGPERASLERMTASMGLQSSVFFTGQIADPAPLYYEFDLFALSSDTEQMPYTVLEAMAAGLPVVATDVGDVRFMLASENERFITRLDAADLGLSMLEVVGNRELANRLGAANRLKVERQYDISAMFDAFAKLYRVAL